MYIIYIIYYSYFRLRIAFLRDDNFDIVTFVVD